MIGRKLTNTHITNFSNAKMKGKIICQYDLNGEFIQRFNNFKEIFDKLNFNKTNIFYCCTGRNKTSYGYVWKYEINNS